MRFVRALVVVAVLLSGCLDVEDDVEPKDDPRTVERDEDDGTAENLTVGAPVADDIAPMPDVTWVTGSTRLRTGAGGARLMLVETNATMRINGLNVDDEGPRFIAAWPTTLGGVQVEPCAAPADKMRLWSSTDGGDATFGNMPAGRYLVFLYSAGGTTSLVHFNGANDRTAAKDAPSLNVSYEATAIAPAREASEGMSYAATFEAALDVPDGALFVGRFTAGATVQQPFTREVKASLVSGNGTVCAEGTAGGSVAQATSSVRLVSLLGPGTFTWSGEAKGGFSVEDRSAVAGLLLTPLTGTDAFWLSASPAAAAPEG